MGRFKAGDKIHLKSGGMTMEFTRYVTVTALSRPGIMPVPDHEEAECFWMEKETVVRAHYREHLLELMG